MAPERETKSISAETTFETDLRAFDDLEPVLWRLSEKVSKRLKAAGLAGQSVTLKLKDKDFRLLTRTRSGLPPTQLAARLFEPARHLLKAACDGTAYRLIGIGAADLVTQRKQIGGPGGPDGRAPGPYGGGHRPDPRQVRRRSPAEGDLAPEASALTGGRRGGLDLKALQIPLKGKIAVIELERPADAILVELEGDRKRVSARRHPR